MVFKAVHQVEFGLTTDANRLRQFRTFHPLEPFVNGELYRECRQETPVWGAKTFRKVILAGGVAWLDPNIVERKAYYHRFPRVTHDRRDLEREAHRHSYMVTKALIEDCIPPLVLAEMVHQGYPWAGWDGHYTDLCSLIMVVQDLMMSVIKSQTLVNYNHLHVGNEDGMKGPRW